MDQAPSSPLLILSKHIERSQPVRYAGASLDFNPIHTDPTAAEAAGLGGVILHGMCTLAFLAEAAINTCGGDPGRVHRIVARFSKPVRPGDTVDFVIDNASEVPAGPTNDQQTLRFSVLNSNKQVVLKDAEVVIGARLS